MLTEIEQLLQLQAVDERLADADARILRLRRESERLQDLIEKEHTSVDASRDALAQLHHDSRMKNLEVDDLDMQIRAYQERLDKGIISFKEMEDLRVKIQSERARISQLEDDALSLMDAIEAKTQDHGEAESELTAREETLRGQIAQAEGTIEETEAELVNLAAERRRIVEAAPSYLVAQYETLHAKLAHPVAEIRAGMCTGCKLRVSGNTTERTRGEIGVVTCEHCSRILYTA